MRTVYVGVIVAVMVCAAHPAGAQSAAEAEALFREGKRLIKAGKLAEGCAKLEASDRLESSTGTLLNLGSCRESNGQLASAWAAFVKAAGLAKRTNDHKRETEAQRRAQSLEGRLAHLEITVAHYVDGLQIQRDDQVVDPEQWNTDLPLDAGAYTIHANAPGHKSWTGTVAVTNGARSTIDVPALAAEAPPPPVTSTTSATTDDGPAQPPAVVPSTFTPTRKVAVAIGIAGVAGVAVGAAFGIVAHDHEHDANAICPQAACADAHAVTLASQGQHDAKIANVMFAVGGAAVVGAAIVWLLGGPSATATEKAVALAPASQGIGLAIAGSF